MITWKIFFSMESYSKWKCPAHMRPMENTQARSLMTNKARGANTTWNTIIHTKKYQRRIKMRSAFDRNRKQLSLRNSMWWCSNVHNGESSRGISKKIYEYINNLRYADDIIPMSKLTNELQQTLLQLQRGSGSEDEYEETEVMLKNYKLNLEISRNVEVIEFIQKYIYLW